MTLFSIAPHARFIATLADRVIDGSLLAGADQTQPFWLTDVTIVLPTRRAKLALADEFARRGHSLLPDIRTFGGEVEDEEPFLPPFDAPTPLPAASGLERRLVLSSLVDQWANSAAGQRAFSSPPTAGEILSMAESLGLLIDDLHTEERGAAEIRAIVPEIEANLGEYWQQTLTFLDIALTYWPLRLDGKKADTAFLRGQRLDRQALATPLVYGDRPVIAAGSTGSIPATARLLRAINDLPRGAVVLPGLDCSMSPDDHAALLDDANNPHGHPQFGLAKLLRSMGAAIADVTELAPDDHPRTTLVHRALALTKDTARWSTQRLSADELDHASTGLSVIRARTEDEEARAVALAARQALSERKTVGIVTPDRNLARRIAAELRRFDVEVDDAAGVPLFQSAAGRLLRQILALATSNCAAVDLMALLRNRATRFGQSRAAISALADAIELGLLRGQRANPGLAGLRQLLAANIEGTTTHPARRLHEADRAPIAALFDQIEAALAPLFALMAEKTIHASALASALCTGFEAVADGADIPGRRELQDWASQMASLTGEGHIFQPRQLDGVLTALMLGAQVRTHEERRSDITIWGQLEARLQNPDLLIVAALNEDKWPEPADPGPWLSRGMRLAAGLNPPERRQGLAAHDFAQALGNPEIIIAYADRVGSSPAIASRLLQRLQAFAGTKTTKLWEQRGGQWLDQARSLDAVPQTRAAPRPAPNPPASTRPRALSVTEIETLMRSPYDVYAKHVLKLRPFDPLGDTPDGRERGTIIHDIFAEFVEQKHDVMAPDAIDTLMAIAAQKFSGLDAIGDRRDIWLRRFHTAAVQFLDFERARDPMVFQRHAEIDGELNLHLSEAFTLRGRADRIDALNDGTLEIIDFKTGSPPTKSAMQAFEVPQLLLEAQMAKAGTLKGDITPANTSALTYIKVGLGPDAFMAKPFTPADGFDLMAAADEITARMQRHIEFFLMRDTPMPARLLPLPGQRFAGAYDHLARVAEWTAVDGGEDAS
ncbi:double-strand break repair protein AddB [Devosia neptuniae]|jgi:ATP-dependent helicase/nuclease subunit B|uniref:double-strand break repair protein AddB n=1 Tax=Devosia TaxID=46913 RepID=UPI0022AF504F|nr:double-strand break repair protein AddB [Devosia neptuniae]MCZ4347714.1 double-strand break repair protein AddB [Devosia neptuniae]|tara:strand:- start:6685 stop:9699 length:3015 start_codon:yes stop_codon:yes gene_type:complete